ncbi:MAG TPA: NAD(P)-binding domain-containing protein [Sandaracinaceae bacterium]
MKIGVLGTGDVGRAIATKLVSLGHEVVLGSRSRGNEKALAWVKETGERAGEGSFADAAAHGSIVFNCTKGEHSLAALAQAGAASLAGKILVDVANPLDFSQGFPPSLTVCNTDSLGEQIQRAYPATKVVKALNTMWHGLMVSPRMLDDTHHTFLSGNDAEAKRVVRGLLESFGWRPEEIIDLGDITTARGTEMYLPLWVRIYGAMRSGAFNIKIVSAKS